MSITRILRITALVLFIVFVATFFTVLVRLSRIGFMTDRYASVSAVPLEGEPPATTWFELLRQEKDTGRLMFHVRGRFDTASQPFNNLKTGDPIVLRVDNLEASLRKTTDLQAQFANPTGDQYVILDFGDLPLDVFDRREFYPFDGYELSFAFAYHVPGDVLLPQGQWFVPQMAVLMSRTSLIYLTPRYVPILPDVSGVRVRIGRLRMQQFLAVTLILIEILFLLYLITIVDLQEILAKGLGYLVVLYIIRNILVGDAPQFPTLIDYVTLFLICVTFFLMLFKFLGGAEERSIITMPPAWRDAFGPLKSNTSHRPDSAEDSESGCEEE